MTIAYDLIQDLQGADPAEAWQAIFNHAWEVCCQPLDPDKADAEVSRRDRQIGDVDLYLATAGWDLWSHYESVVDRTSQQLVDWWSGRDAGRAVLMLDALSLREAPWILAGAEQRGFTVHASRPTGAELPADTTPFAKALGFGQRSSLGNNGAGGAHKLQGAHTETVDIAWGDCAAMIGSEPDWVFWHHWPDSKLHAHDDPGKGLSSLTAEVVEHLTGDEFWTLVERLAEGRRLIITGDHGYAASGLFTDCNKDETGYLKKIFGSRRWDGSAEASGNWVPPIDLLIESQHGRHLFVNGRRKWKSAGGYPTLTHGGLTVLEVAVPFIELSRT
ncbi:MAG: hypothetical protein R3E01_13450 [Pirellulaceae bacterium]